MQAGSDVVAASTSTRTSWSRLSRWLTVGVRHPRGVLGAWFSGTVVLALIGLNVGAHLHGGGVLVPGSPSAVEAQRFAQEFGNEVSAPVLLSGPRAELDRQGPRLAAALAELPGAEVVSAWDGGRFGKVLRPSADDALILVSVAPRAGTSTAAIETSVQNLVDDDISAPLSARVSGTDAIGAELQSASLRAVHDAELIAIPVLLIVLLLVFGSPMAALVPVVVGFGTVLSAAGVISLLGSLMSLTVLASTAASMMGLALGVDYSLLLVARYRDELVDPSDPDDVTRAASLAAVRAGRTVAFAGGAIATVMLLALTVAAGTLLLSAVVGLIVVAGVSVLATLLAVPAALVLLGPRIPGRRAADGESPFARGTAAAAGLFRSGPVVAVSLVALLAVGVNALSLATGPPSASQLPADSAAQQDYSAISRGVGAGWVTPFELLVTAHSDAITTLPRLDALAAAQDAIAREPDVAAVIGPAELARRAAPLATAEQSVNSTRASLTHSAHVIGGLNSDLGQAASGAQSVQSGFAQATAAVQKLASSSTGGESAAIGALQSGLDRAASGSREIGSGLGQAAGAATRIAGGGSTMAADAQQLLGELRSDGAQVATVSPKLGVLAQELDTQAASLAGLTSSVNALGQTPSGVTSAGGELNSAVSELQAMRIGRIDSHYRAVLADVQAAQGDLASATASTATTLASQIAADATSERAVGTGISTLAVAAAQLSTSASALEQEASTLPAEITTLQSGQRALASGIARLVTSEAEMTAGLGSLSTGTAALSGRLAALESGVNSVESGLSGEQRNAAALSSALSSGSRRAAGGSRTGNTSILGTLASNPGFFRSGYLVLAALEGSAAARRAGVGFLINVAHNGQAARMLVIPRSGVRSAATAALRGELVQIAASLEAKTGLSVLVGGPAAQLSDYAHSASHRLPLLVAVLMLATLVILVIVFRSLFVPLIAVLLNLLSVTAAFGALSLLTRGQHPLIGGPGYVDALSVSAMFAVVFALSLDYQVFLLMRMREGWLATGSTEEGVTYGIARTARVVAGAAAIMGGVFLAFSSSSVAPIRQLGVGLAVAIVIDATIVRLVLLPWALRAGGELTWWLPERLDRVLPVIDIGAERRFPAGDGDPQTPEDPPGSSGDGQADERRLQPV